MLQKSAFHENLKRSDEVQVSSGRSFGLVFAAVFLVIGLCQMLDSAVPRCWASGMAAVFLAVAAAYWRVFAPLNRWWLKLALNLIDGLTQGSTLLADRVYAVDAIRDSAIARGVWPNISSMQQMCDTVNFSSWGHRRKNVLKRVFNKIKYFRAAAARCEKFAENYLAMARITAIRNCIRDYEPAT